MQHTPIPHLNLTTAQQGPLFPVEKIILKNIGNIEEWFQKEFLKTPPPITSSVDLRHARYKLAPVDTNLFPGGYNNLNHDFLSICIQAAKNYLSENCSKILIIPENHTRNKFYTKSLVVLCDIFLNAGFSVRLGSIAESTQDVIELKTEEGDVLLLDQLIRQNNRVVLADFDPCLILLNNDLSTGIPEILRDIEQRIEPSIGLGWSSRLKSQHFEQYNNVANELSDLIKMDPWFINPFFTHCDNVNFLELRGIEQIAVAVDDLIFKIQEKYQKYKISDKPFVVIKADNGTYGMSVMMVKSGEELLAINRKTRTHMSTTKGRQTVSKVIIQEGVYSFEIINKFVSEPVIYMIGQYIVGGFYLVHQNRGVTENLNSPGMHFEPLAFAGACHMLEEESKIPDASNRFYVYGVIARLATLAAAREMKNI